jgi:hypothetical protein
MRQSANGRTVALVAAALVVLASGYLLGRESGLRLPVPNEDTFKVDAQKVLGQTITSLKAENKLVVYRYSADARVKTTVSYGLLKGDQQLIVPASVVYFIDMAEFGPEDVRYDKASETVEIKLPPLKLGDISFQPEQAAQINGGLITVSNAVVADLARDNYAGARVAFTRLAQNPQIVEQAKAQAIKNVTSQFEVPLRAVGHADVKVRADFR